MNELDDRLRSALRDLARTVPRNPQARADFERRLAERQRTRWRTPLLATAAAATVLVGVAIPVVMNQNEAPDQGHVVTPPTSTSTTTSPSGPMSGTPTPSDGYLFAGPIELGHFEDGGVERAAVMTVEQEGDGERICVMVKPQEGSSAAGAGCSPVPGWPNTPAGTGFVWTHTILNGEPPYGGPLPNLMVFMTAPEVATLEVRHGNASPVPTALVAVSPTTRFYLADFGDTHAGFGYTAKDPAGIVLESAIT